MRDYLQEHKHLNTGYNTGKMSPPPSKVPREWWGLVRTPGGAVFREADLAWWPWQFC